MFNEFVGRLKYRLALPLPGANAHFMMAHPYRRQNFLYRSEPPDAKKSSVLILLYMVDNSVTTALIVRQEYEGVHSGQVAFPGGRFEEADIDLKTTALREAGEEIGIIPSDIEIVGQLTKLYIPPSNFVVFPFLGIASYHPSFHPDNDEVKEVIEVNIHQLLDNSIIGEKEILLANKMRVRSPYFDIKGYTVWGATAMILSELKQILHEMEMNSSLP
jgi:8-oxo-dGTP pyrophosphatase MutT (NUDIX family)